LLQAIKEDLSNTNMDFSSNNYIKLDAYFDYSFPSLSSVTLNKTFKGA